MPASAPARVLGDTAWISAMLAPGERLASEVFVLVRECGEVVLAWLRGRRAAR
jgi:hypothetical protein